MEKKSRYSSVSTLSGQLSPSVAQPFVDSKGIKLIPASPVINQFPIEIEAAVEKIRRSNLFKPERFLITLLLRNGLRVSEIAEPQFMDFLDGDKVLVYAFKQKKWKYAYIYDGEFLDMQERETEQIKGWNRSRQYYYRVFAQYFRNVPSRRIHNNSVTHAARNLIAQQAFAKSFDIKDVMRAIGVMQEKSAQRYLTCEQFDYLCREREKKVGN